MDEYTTKTVVYCEICKFPPEYCEFGKRLSECEQWLQESHPDLYAQFYQQPTTPIEEKPPRSDESPPSRETKKVPTGPRILITTIERNKRKRLTTICGLDSLGINLKKAAKQMATKFACGASVTTNNQGVTEIIIQGEVAEGLATYLPATWPSLISSEDLKFVKPKK